MTRFRIILAVSLLLAAMVGVAAMAWTFRRPHESQVMRESQLINPNEDLRFAAAASILAINADHQLARLVEAERACNVKNYVKARELLLPVEVDRDSPHRQAAMELHLRVAVDEMRNIVASSSPSALPHMEHRIDALTDEARGRIGRMPEASSQFPLPVMMESRMADVRSAMHHQIAVDLAGRRSQSDALGDAGESLQTSLEIARRELLRTQSDKRMNDMLDRLAELDPANPYIDAMNMNGALRRNDFAAARRYARDLASSGELPKWLAADAAIQLLTLESRYAAAAHEEDVRIAEMLLKRPVLSGPGVDDLMVAEGRARVELATGRPNQAIRSARKMLQLYPDHAAFMLIEGEALTDIGRAEEAIDRLMKVRERSRTAEVAHAIAKAQIAAGLRSQGLESFREAIDIDPHRLTAWLDMAEAIGAGGHLIESGSYINAAEKLNANHPRVRDLQCRLAMAQMDIDRLVVMMDEAVIADPRAAARVLAVMAIDDVQAVRRYSDQVAKTAPALTRLALAWAQTEPRMRMEAAGLFAWRWHGGASHPLDAPRSTISILPPVRPADTTRPLDAVILLPDTLHLAVAALRRMQELHPDDDDAATILAELQQWFSFNRMSVLLSTNDESRRQVGGVTQAMLAVVDAINANDATAAEVQFQAFLQRSPSNPPALWRIFQAAREANDAAMNETMLRNLATANPRLADIVRARLAWVSGDMQATIYQTTLRRRDPSAGPRERSLVTETEVAAHWIDGDVQMVYQTVRGESLMNLPLASPWSLVESDVAALIDMPMRTVATLETLLVDSPSPVWRDEAFERLMLVSGSTDSVRRRVERWIDRRDVESLPLTWAAEAWLMEPADSQRVRALLGRLSTDDRQRTRPMLLEARALAAAGHVESAVETIQPLLERDRRAAAAAKQFIDQWHTAPAPRGDGARELMSHTEVNRHG